jgi:hypothetical protein
MEYLDTLAASPIFWPLSQRAEQNRRCPDPRIVAIGLPDPGALEYGGSFPVRAARACEGETFQRERRPSPRRYKRDW